MPVGLRLIWSLTAFSIIHLQCLTSTFVLGSFCFSLSLHRELNERKFDKPVSHKYCCNYFLTESSNTAGKPPHFNKLWQTMISELGFVSNSPFYQSLDFPQSLNEHWSTCMITGFLSIFFYFKSWQNFRVEYKFASRHSKRTLSFRCHWEKQV